MTEKEEEWRYVVLHIQSQCISLQQTQLAHYNQLLAPSIMILGSANPTALTLLASTDGMMGQRSVAQSC